MKLTFKQYLLELDQSDLELLQNKKDARSNKKEFGSAANDFEKQMQQDRLDKSGAESKEGEPVKGDLIQTKSDKLIVTRRTKEGFYIKKIGSDSKELLMKHGYKYKEVDKTALGKKVFKVFK